MFSVQNTSNPLRLKIHNTPCLCPPCIADDGQECVNGHFTDKWREVELVPLKGDNIRKHMKCKHPREYIAVQRSATDRIQNEPMNDGVSDEEDDINVPEMLLDNIAQDEMEEYCQGNEQTGENEDDISIDLTEGAENITNDETIVIDEELEDSDIIITNEDYNSNPSLELFQSTEVIPDWIYWESKLAALEGCASDGEFEKTAIELSKTLKALRPSKKVTFIPERHRIDNIASCALPADGPKNV